MSGAGGIQQGPTFLNPKVNIQKWGDDIIKDGHGAFVEKFGVGPCGPVADNIAAILVKEGKDARVAFCEFGVPAEAEIGNGFGHYITVELEKNKVIKIYDPTNPMARNPIISLKKKGTKELFKMPEEYTTELDIFKKGLTSYKDDPNTFTKEMFEWWKGKL